MNKEYFIVCEYRSNFPHQAYFIPCDNVDLKNKFNEINSLVTQLDPPIIVENYEKSEYGHCCTGYIINDTLDCSKKTSDIVGYWISQINYDGDSDGFVYYINDENRDLSPRDLHNKLLSMTELEDKSFVVKKCIMISDKVADYQKPIVLRFFLVTKISLTCDDVAKRLLKDPRICHVQTSSKNKVDFGGFGYIYLTKKEFANDFVENNIEIDGLEIFSDRG
jgi:hypothetical protein